MDFLNLKKMQEKEAEIKKLQEEIAISTKQGFAAPQDKAEELEKLKEQYVALDPRTKLAPVESKPEEIQQEESLIKTKKTDPDPVILDQFGRPFKKKEQPKVSFVEPEPQKKSLHCFPTKIRFLKSY